MHDHDIVPFVVLVDIMVVPVVMPVMILDKVRLVIVMNFRDMTFVPGVTLVLHESLVLDTPLGSRLHRDGSLALDIVAALRRGIRGSADSADEHERHHEFLQVLVHCLVPFFITRKSILALTLSKERNQELSDKSFFHVAGRRSVKMQPHGLLGPRVRSPPIARA